MVQAVDTGDFHVEPNELDASYRLADYVFIVCILAFGGAAFFSRDRAGGFLYDDVYYAIAQVPCWSADLRIAGRPETTQPPGSIGNPRFVVLAGSCTRAVFLGAMAVFEMLGCSWPVMNCFGAMHRERGWRDMSVADVFFAFISRWLLSGFPPVFRSVCDMTRSAGGSKAGQSGQLRASNSVGVLSFPCCSQPH